MDTRYRLTFKIPKWNVRVTATMDTRAMRRAFPERVRDKAWHLDRSLRAMRLSGYAHEEWQIRASEALRQHGDGDGVLIAGVIRDHFPPEVKEHLRGAAHTASDLRGISLAHWQAAGKTPATWQREVAAYWD